MASADGLQVPCRRTVLNNGLRSQRGPSGGPSLGPSRLSRLCHNSLRNTAESPSAQVPQWQHLASIRSTSQPDVDAFLSLQDPSITRGSLLSLLLATFISLPLPPRPNPWQPLTIVVSSRRLWKWNHTVVTFEAVWEWGGRGFLHSMRQLPPHPQHPTPPSAPTAALRQQARQETPTAHGGGLGGWGTSHSAPRGRGDVLTWGGSASCSHWGLLGQGTPPPTHTHCRLFHRDRPGPQSHNLTCPGLGVSQTCGHIPKYAGPRSVGLVDTVLKDSFGGKREKRQGGESKKMKRRRRGKEGGAVWPSLKHLPGPFPPFFLLPLPGPQPSDLDSGSHILRLRPTPSNTGPLRQRPGPPTTP